MQTDHTSRKREVTISIRAQSKQRDLIDQAAEALGKNRSDFMLETTCRKAENVLLDQTYFALEGDIFQTFKELVDNPNLSSEKLRRKLSKKMPLETARRALVEQIQQAH